MPSTQIVINVFNGDVQDVFCTDETAQVIIVNWDVDASVIGEPGICAVELPNAVLNAAVSASKAHPFHKLPGSDVQAAIDVAYAQGVLPAPA